MEIMLNGKTTKTNHTDILGLVSELNLPLEGLVVLHNDEIIKKSEYPSLFFKENDKIELLNFVSGG